MHRNSAHKKGNVYHTTYNFFNNAQSGQRARSAETPIDDDSVLFTISSPDVREARTVRQQRTWVPLAPPPAQQPQQQPQDPQPSQNSDNNDRRRDDQGNIDFDCD